MIGGMIARNHGTRSRKTARTRAPTRKNVRKEGDEKTRSECRQDKRVGSVNRVQRRPVTAGRGISAGIDGCMLAACAESIAAFKLVRLV